MGIRVRVGSDRCYDVRGVGLSAAADTWAPARTESRPDVSDDLIRRSVQTVRDGPQRSLSGVESCVMILVDGLIVDRVAVSVAVSSSIM